MSIQMTAVELTKRFNIKFTWMPGHRNNEENLMANKAAKEAACSRREETQQVKTSWSLIKNLLNKHFWCAWNSEWVAETENSKITKRFFPKTNAAKILKNKHLPHQLIQIPSGHSRHRTFLHRINASEIVYATADRKRRRNISYSIAPSSMPAVHHSNPSASVT